MWPVNSLFESRAFYRDRILRARIALRRGGGRMPGIRKMNPQSLRYPRIRRVGGIAIALLLAAGFFFSMVPIASVSAGNICTLACCAGRTPHAAGSCMNGTCHAAIRLRKRTNRFATEPTEKLCGLKTFKARNVDRTVVPPQRSDSQPSSLQVSMLVRPCQPDCGGASGFVSSYSPGKAVTTSAADQPRPLALSRSLAAFNRAHTLEVLCRECAPRGPPTKYLV